MRTLGVSAYYRDSAVAHIHNSKIESAAYESSFSRELHDCSFPTKAVSWVKNVYEDFDQVVFYEKAFLNQAKTEIKKITKAEVILVDHHKAHAMSSIIVKNWSKAAVLVVDCLGGEYSLSLGYYDGKTIEWIKRFKYPNSLGLLYSAVTRFLGFTPLRDEYKTMIAARQGQPLWKKWVYDNLIESKNYDFTILQDLRRGMGIGHLDYNIASTAQTVLQEIIINLADWLYVETGCSNLAFSGQLAYNADLNSVLYASTLFKDIAVASDPGEGGCALGAAAIIDKPLWESAYLGVDQGTAILPDEHAEEILKGKIVSVVTGKTEFSPYSLGNRAFICAPFTENVKKLNSMLKQEDWLPYSVICQQKDISEYFKGKADSYYKHFSLSVVKSNYKTDYNSLIVQATSYTHNPYINRILEITRQHGFPILLCADLKAPNKPLVNTYDDFKNEIAAW
jgi:carbamoyltransferase